MMNFMLIICELIVFQRLFNIRLISVDPRVRGSDFTNSRRASFACTHREESLLVEETILREAENSFGLSLSV